MVSPYQSWFDFEVDQERKKFNLDTKRGRDGFKMWFLTRVLLELTKKVGLMKGSDKT